jgi:hypothetical protein
MYDYASNYSIAMGSMLSTPVMEGWMLQSFRPPPSIFDLMLVASAVTFLNASAYRCWATVKMTLYPGPVTEIPLILQLIPQALSPSWNFFAPHPGSHDLRLLVRYQIRGHITPWSEPAEFRPKDGTLMLATWNPHRYMKKLLLDLLSTLIVDLCSLRSVDAKPEQYNALQLTTGYLGCLKIATLRAPKDIESEVQFAVVRTSDSLDVPEMPFMSNWHSVKCVA